MCRCARPARQRPAAQSPPRPQDRRALIRSSTLFQSVSHRHGKNFKPHLQFGILGASRRPAQKKKNWESAGHIMSRNDRTAPGRAVGRKRAVLHQPDAVRIHVVYWIFFPALRYGMTIRIRKISRPSVIGGGTVPDGGGIVILVEIDEEMGVVN